MDTNIFATWLDKWLEPCGIIFLTLIAASLVRSAFKRFASNRRFETLQQLVPYAGYLIYVVGLHAAIAAAPINPKLAQWIGSAVYVLGVIVFLALVRRAAMTAMEWSALRTNNSKTLQQGFIPLLRNLVTLFIFFSGAIMVLKHFQYDVLSLLTALGVGSLAVGLAAKDTLSNMISGFTLIIDRNLSPGDRVNLGGSVGDVEEIGLRSTTIRTGSGNTLIVPNSDLVNTKILNMSRPSRAVSCGSTFRVPTTIPFLRVKAICLDIMNGIERVDQVREKWVNLSSLADGHQTISVGFWVSDMDSEGGTVSAFNEKLVERFKSEEIAFHV